MSFTIYGLIEQQNLTFVGCTKSIALPSNAIFLQSVEDHPELYWVKWGLRFRRTLKDKKALAHPYAAFFSNSRRLKRLLGDEAMQRDCAATNAAFLQFHRNNLDVFDELLADARREKLAGRTIYSASESVGDIRWGGTQTNPGESRFKISSTFVAWYARALQMTDGTLIGFFRMRSCIADGLVWVDGRIWAEFAAQHEEELHWSDQFQDFPDSEFEYNDPA